DKEDNLKNLALNGTPRWTLAAKDAELKFPKAAETFSCALNAPITEQDTPYLYILLRRTLMDAGLSTYSAKQMYERPRPFIVNGEPICTPEKVEHLKESGSYPSGHTAIGWAWALILAEIAPEHVNEIITRGRVFGESRKICNVHWHSDIVAGRLVGASVVARLHADPTFIADLEAAKAELASVREKGLKPTHDCQVEVEALTQN
ncbi:MAG: phosphatase PAP2 family protein, partial [Deltaproteobacteria bacterium]|nr:phosphatase PAP2 family protein [Deltaproteobacteria bacterium]